MLTEERRTGTTRPNLDRNLSFELARVTEAAALASARWMGKGDKIAADQAAVNAMRFALDSVDMDGIVVIGEGEKDEAPMLYTGERIGNGLPPEADIAVDPVDGTTLLSKGLPELRLGRRAGQARLDARLEGHRLHGEDRRRAGRQGPRLARAVGRGEPQGAGLGQEGATSTT